MKHPAPNRPWGQGWLLPTASTTQTTSGSVYLPGLVRGGDEGRATNRRPVAGEVGPDAPEWGHNVN